MEEYEKLLDRAKELIKKEERDLALLRENIEKVHLLSEELNKIRQRSLK